MTDLWTEASFDAEGAMRAQKLAVARSKVTPVWAVLAAATSKRDYENRKAILAERIAEAADDVETLEALEASLDADYDTIYTARVHEATVRARVAAEAARRRQAAGEQGSEGTRQGGEGWGKEPDDGWGEESDSSTCDVCGDSIVRDPKGEKNRTWHHDSGTKHDHEAKPKAAHASLQHQATRYCKTHEVFIGDGNEANHDEACSIENRKTEKSSARKTAVHLTNVSFEGGIGSNVGKGTDPSGKVVRFRLTDQEAKDLAFVLTGDLAVNFSGVDVDTADIIEVDGNRTMGGLRIKMATDSATTHSPDTPEGGPHIGPKNECPLCTTPGGKADPQHAIGDFFVSEGSRRPFVVEAADAVPEGCLGCIVMGGTVIVVKAGCPVHDTESKEASKKLAWNDGISQHTGQHPSPSCKSGKHSSCTGTNPSSAEGDIVPGEGKCSCDCHASWNRGASLQSSASKRYEFAKEIVADGFWDSNGKEKKLEGQLVDLNTARLLVQAYEALSPENQAKFDDVDLLKLVDMLWSRAKFSALKTVAGENPFPPKKDTEQGAPDANSDEPAENSASSFDPTQMQPGQQVTINYTMTNNAGSGATSATFESNQNGVFYFTYEKGRFGVTQQGGKWVDSQGSEFTFADAGGGEEKPAEAPAQNPPAQARRKTASGACVFCELPGSDSTTSVGDPCHTTCSMEAEIKRSNTPGGVLGDPDPEGPGYHPGSHNPWTD